jgi:tetratricopeptide (TPR) repeat protein
MFKKKKKSMKSSVQDFDFTAPKKTEAEQPEAEAGKEGGPAAEPEEASAGKPVSGQEEPAPDQASGAAPSQEAENGDKPFLEAQGEAPPGPGGGKPLGVFSKQKMTKIGTGTTQRRVLQQFYYFAEQLQDGRITVQALNPDHVPSGDKETISKDTLLDQYLPEPDMYHKDVLPKLKDIQKNMARGDRYRKLGKTFSAEMEYGKVLKVDEENIRANFSIGLCYMERDEKSKANEVFERLVKLDSTFEQEHKHLFNEFGINLRKNRMLEQAVDYYTRALELTRNDENLHYNAARAYYELGKSKEAAKHLKECLRMNPEHEHARKFVEFLRKKKQLRGGPVETSGKKKQDESQAGT